MQASSSWAPPGGTLGRILEETRLRVTSLDRVLSADRALSAADVPLARTGHLSLLTALRAGSLAVIAEIKRKSPAKGSLAPGLDPGENASAFARGGAVAISVLTEPSFFDGSLDDLAAVRAAVDLPVLRKDFHIDPLQLVEAKRASATAVLLIARALQQPQLVKLLEFAARLELEALVEVRSEAELERALDAGATMIGVNSRDLETLEIDERVPERLMPRIPSSVIGVWESGVSDVNAVRRAPQRGADAVLVGSALSRAADPATFVRSLTGVARQPRHG